MPHWARRPPKVRRWTTATTRRSAGAGAKSGMLNTPSVDGRIGNPPRTRACPSASCAGRPCPGPTRTDRSPMPGGRAAAAATSATAPPRSAETEVAIAHTSSQQPPLAHAARTTSSPVRPRRSPPPTVDTDSSHLTNSAGFPRTARRNATEHTDAITGAYRRHVVEVHDHRDAVLERRPVQAKHQLTTVDPEHLAGPAPYRRTQQRRDHVASSANDGRIGHPPRTQAVRARRVRGGRAPARSEPGTHLTSKWQAGAG